MEVLLSELQVEEPQPMVLERSRPQAAASLPPKALSQPQTASNRVMSMQTLRPLFALLCARQADVIPIAPSSEHEIKPERRRS